MSRKVKVLDWFFLILLITGACNWAAIGFFQVDIVASIFGSVSSYLARFVYILFGLAGLYGLTFFSKIDGKINRLKDLKIE